MIHVDRAVVVEGKYDKIKLSSIIDGVIIVTNGFGIFKDKEKCELIKFYAKTKGLIVLTDSDASGFRIRSQIKNITKNDNVLHVYVPDIFGKEKRKMKPSKEGKLGVEGMSVEILENAFEKAGVISKKVDENRKKITKVDFFEDGLSGRQNSSVLRKSLLKKLGLPELLSANSLLDILNSVYSFDEYKKLVDKITNNG